MRLIHIRFGQHHDIIGAPEDEQESVEQNSDAIEKLVEVYGEEIQEATMEQIQTAEPDQSPSTIEKQSTTLPEPLVASTSRRRYTWAISIRTASST